MSPGSLPFVNLRTANLSFPALQCTTNSCRTHTVAQQPSQHELRYYSYQYKYALFTVWYFTAIIGVSTVFHLLHICHVQYISRRTSSKRPTPGPRSIGVLPKVVAVWRWVAYRRIPGWPSYQLDIPPTGIMLFLLMAIVFLSILVFAQRPYYRPASLKGSGAPPIASRAGSMAVALTPLIVALGGKANIITLLTGISYEKLNIIHRWVGWMIFCLSLVHTIPFTIAPIRDARYTTWPKGLYVPSSYMYTGIAPLVSLFLVVILSLPIIRRYLHAIFYHSHVLLSIIYIGMLFWHSNNQGNNSWIYLWTALGIWLSSHIVRWLWFSQPTSITTTKHWLQGARVSFLQCVEPDVMKMRIDAPHGFTWRPGQHVYLRLPAIAFWDASPFSIASSFEPCYHIQHTVVAELAQPSPISSLEPPPVVPEVCATTQASFMLLIRARAGFTRRLQKRLLSCSDPSASPQLTAWLDGPYGGLTTTAPEYMYDNVLLVAGGGGISACLPWLEHFAMLFRQSQQSSPAASSSPSSRIRTKYVKLIWSIREEPSISWIAEELERLDLPSLQGTLTHASDPGGRVEVAVHVTGSSRFSRGGDCEQGMPVLREQKTVQAIPGVSVWHGRVQMSGPQGVLFNDLLPGSSTLVIGCGPESFQVALSNACADVQREVWWGHLGGVRVELESFGM